MPFNVDTSLFFTSKANTLLSLKHIEELNIPDICLLTYEDWRNNNRKSLDEINNFVSQNKFTSLAIRSSCSREDSVEQSGAGAFTSLLNVSATDERALSKAINTVFESYKEIESSDQVLIQPMITDVEVSGVIMTKSLDDGSPYYVINYDDETGKTDTITSGIHGTKSVYIYRDAQDLDFDSKRLLKFVNFAKKIEEICGRNDLDIEFCMENQGKIWLLQVRPICAKEQWISSANTYVRTNINYIVDFLQKRTKQHPELFGKTTILGVMPDWNPAEIIGITPRPLASSLYRELITKRVWSDARELMGYRAMPPEELMLLLANRPYIDCRVSFNSFLPKDLDETTCETIISEWIHYLDANPSLHDKVEFDILQTILDFSFDSNMENRYPNMLSKKRKEAFRNALKVLTNNCLNFSREKKTSTALDTVALAFDLITELQNRQASYKDIHLLDKDNILSYLMMLCEECKKLGTLPFSILARHAFIAETLLRTAVERGVLSEQRLLEFKNSLYTISSEMSEDYMKVCKGEMYKENFLHRYGHLRPSSYDILSPRYVDRENLFAQNSISLELKKAQFFKLNDEEECAITKLMQETGLDGDARELFDYARKVIPAREWAKFVFTKNLSNILEGIATWGESLGLSREELSYLNFKDIIEWAAHPLLKDSQIYFNELVKKGQELYNLSCSLKLGYIIRSSRDIYVVAQHRSTPNFIGKKSVEAKVVYLYPQSDCSENIENSIVCIENADPGFDWIFTRNIAGLITKFGGTNSHMAIRCAEYSLPAAIGVGEVLFEKVIQVKSCILNAGTNTLHLL